MTNPPRSSAAPELVGVRILVLEDDTLILMEMETVLADAGAEIVGLCRSVKEAMAYVESAKLDVAILDFGLTGETVAPVARRCVERGLPFVFYTGQVETDPRLMEWDVQIIAKPAAPRTIIAGIIRALAAAPALLSSPAVPRNE